MKALPFELSWSIEQSESLFLLLQKEPASGAPNDKEWVKRYEQRCDSFARAVGQHILFLGSEGRIHPAPHTENVDSNWKYYWDMACDPYKHDQFNSAHVQLLSIVFSTVFHDLCYAVSRPKEGRPAPSDYQAFHAHLKHRVEEGTLGPKEVFSDECHYTGHNFQVLLNHWQPTYYMPKVGLNPGQALTAETIPPPSLQHASIPVPSGEMLGFGSLAHPAFREALEKAKQKGKVRSVNSTVGRERRTHAMAEVGMVELMCSDGSIELCMGENGVRAGTVLSSEAKKKLSPHRLSVDSSWVYLVDRQVLTGLLAENGLGNHSADWLEGWLEEQGENVVQFQLEPGVHHLYFAGDARYFQETIQDKSIEFEEGFAPSFVLSSSELAPRPRRSLPPRW